MKIAHCHRHIAKSEYQPCIAVQTHDTSLFPPKDTTGNTDSLLFLKIVLQRPVHQLDIVRHGFIQIDKFLHLTLRNYRRTVCVIVRHQILAGKHGRQNTFQLPQGSTYKQPTVAFNPFLIRQRIQFLSGAGSKSLFHHPGRVTASGIFLFGISISGIKVTTLKPAALVSNSFTWEKVTTVDVGFDLGLLNNRLNLVFDWYRRDTKGMLAPGAELPAVLGASAPLQNTADLRSKGWEITVDWNDQIGKVKYNLGFNLYDAKTKITKYNNETGLFGKDKNDKDTYRVGMELGEIWGYVTDRLYTVDDFDADGKLKAGIPKVEGYNPNPGDILYKDLDDNDIINGGTSTTKDPGDRKIIGNSTRRYQYGIHGGANWKGVSLSFLLQGVGKRDLWIMNDLFYPHYDAWTTVYDTQLNYWTPERTDSYFPRLYEKAAGNTAANTRIQTRYLQDGSYLSIRNITLSYNFPSKWMTKIGVNNLAVFFSGENLYTFDHLPKGLDPERSVTDDLGQRGFTYPYMRQYSFGINLSF